MHVCAATEEISVEAKLLIDRGCQGDEAVAAKRCGEFFLARFRLAGAQVEEATHARDFRTQTFILALQLREEGIRRWGRWCMRAWW